MTRPMYFVKDEHTLGYVTDAQLHLFQVLAGKPQLGGHDWKNGPVPLSRQDKLRPATKDDFDFYRVCPKGHLEDC